jgi:hypothetical protein
MKDMAIKERSGRSVLGADVVLEAVELHREKIPRREISERLGINVNTLKSIFYGYNWSHLTGIVPKRKRKILPTDTSGAGVNNQ